MWDLHAHVGRNGGGTPTREGAPTLTCTRAASKNARLDPNVTTYYATISACEQGYQLERAPELLAEMQERIIEPIVITYSAAISACGKWQPPELALELLAEIRRRGLEPTW